MRLWSLHPRYLDSRGLVALWREGLLAQAVLSGNTRGYTRHPQLERFLAQRAPAACLRAYLRGVHAESVRRGYTFDAGKIGRTRWSGPLTVTRGQLDYEWAHLERKLASRSEHWLRDLGDVTEPEAHPVFRVVPGLVEAWERTGSLRPTTPTDAS